MINHKVPREPFLYRFSLCKNDNRHIYKMTVMVIVIENFIAVIQHKPLIIGIAIRLGLYSKMAVVKDIEDRVTFTPPQESVHVPWDHHLNPYTVKLFLCTYTFQAKNIEMFKTICYKYSFCPLRMRRALLHKFVLTNNVVTYLI